VAIAASVASRRAAVQAASQPASVVDQCVEDARTPVTQSRGLAAALENLPVAAYGMALTEAQGSYGRAPSIGTFVTTAMSQHKDKRRLETASHQGRAERVTSRRFDHQCEVAKLQAAKSIPRRGEGGAGAGAGCSQTYTFATANVSDAGGIMTAATIQRSNNARGDPQLRAWRYPAPMSFVV